MTPASQSSITLPQRIIDADPGDFCEKFNRLPFQFSHHLGNHPLFTIPRLVELAKTLTRLKIPIACQVGQVPVDRKWLECPDKEDVIESIADIQTSDSWAILYQVQKDPEFAALLDQIVFELEELTGQALRKQITWIDAYIFIASPGSITPYHIDHETNFLLQIHGEKDTNLFDPADQSVLTEQEMERYYTGDTSAANYREAVQNKAYCFHLSPGKGVHHPVRAPHWVKNGHSYSVSLSINFCLKSFDRQARIYQVNHYLRKLGFQPTPPGQSAWKDKTKIFALGLLSKRHPTTKYELIRSGITRVQKSTQWLTQFIKR